MDSQQEIAAYGYNLQTLQRHDIVINGSGQHAVVVAAHEEDDVSYVCVAWLPKSLSDPLANQPGEWPQEWLNERFVCLKHRPDLTDQGGE